MSMPINRREFLAVAATAVATQVQAVEPLDIIDTHTHFYDPTRPEGVDWPGKGDKLLYRPVLPPEFVKLTKPHFVTGTIVVEASPRLSDNDWLLKLADDHPIIVGVVGRLDLKHPKFAEHVATYHKHKKYLGFRINHGDLKDAAADAKVIGQLNHLIDAGLCLDVNGGPELLPTLIEVAKKFPKLSIVLNHMGNVVIDGKTVPATWKDHIGQLSDLTNVSCKISALVESSRARNGNAPKDLAYYLPTIEVVWNAFGDKRLMYGSDWPVSENAATYGTIITIMREFLKDKPEATQRQIWGKNARRIYGV